MIQKPHLLKMMGLFCFPFLMLLKENAQVNCFIKQLYDF